MRSKSLLDRGIRVADNNKAKRGGLFNATRVTGHLTDVMCDETSGAEDEMLSCFTLFAPISLHTRSDVETGNGLAIQRIYEANEETYDMILKFLNSINILNANALSQ